MRILFLAQRVPYPPNRGDKITTWRLVERMQRTHEVICVAFAHGPADLAAAAELGRMGIRTLPFRHRERWKKLASLPLFATRRPLTLGVYGSRALQAAVDRLVPEVDMAYAYSSSMGAFLLRHAGLPRVMHLGELDSDKWRQYAEQSSFPMSRVYAREARTLLAFERRVAHAVTENVLCTPLEQRIFQERIPGASSTVLRNGVDLARFVPDPTLREPGHLVFTGVMNYHPNADGCLWFAREVLPAVQAALPGARFSIVGAHPTREVERLGELPGVTVTGFVDDTVEWLQRASVAVAPLRIARGIQNKVLEAMACGLAVVGTTSATQGVGAEPGKHYRVMDDAAGFARATIELLRDEAAARALGAAARSYVEEHYDWELVFRPLDDILDKCARARVSRS